MTTRLLVDFTSEGPAAGWTVRYVLTRADGVTAPLPRAADGSPWSRSLSRRGADGVAYPIPPVDEVAAPDPGAAPGALYSQADAVPILAVHGRIAERKPDADDIACFGRYLFDVLLGKSLWQDLRAAIAPTEPIELAVAVHHTDIDLQRLPWEMAHNGARFLAQEPRVALVRRVKGGAAPAARPPCRPPRVLFIVGSALDDEAIRPGAEYLRLLQSLRRQGTSLSLRTHLIQKASKETLAAAVGRHRPDVVHLICHGDHDAEGKPFLELVDPQQPGGRAPIYPLQLLQSLKTDGTLPPIVVLSACHSASAALARTGDVGTPLAAALVAGGVPLVLGMAGRVSDQACRLFTRRFYEALLEGSPIAFAAGEGRLAALCGVDSNPESSVDWSLPAIFTTDDDAWTSLPFEADPSAQRWYDASVEVAPGPFPVFCDRLTMMEKLDYLLADRSLQQILQPNSLATQVLAVSVDVKDDETAQRGRFGRSWLLREMAAQALREGHVACLVDAGNRPGNLPKDLPSLLRLVHLSVQATATRLGLPERGLASVFQLLGLQPGQAVPADLPESVRTAAAVFDPKSAPVLATAWRADLLDLLEKARALISAEHRPHTRLLLLIDDLHRMGADVVSDLLNTLLGTAGLRGAKDDIRIVFSYSSAPITGQQPTVKAIDDWFGGTNWVERMTLGPFPGPAEEELAYQHFLLHWRGADDQPRPLAVREASKLRRPFFDALSKEVKGVPSRLAQEGSRVVDIYLPISDQVLPLFRAVDDEARLKDIAELERD